MFCSHYLEDNGDVAEEIPPNLWGAFIPFTALFHGMLKNAENLGSAGINHCIGS